MRQLMILAISFIAYNGFAQQTIRLTQGTQVRVILDENLDSGISQQGDMINLVSANDVYVGDQLIINKGAKVSGQITLAKRSKMLGKKGKLDFTVDYIQAIDGRNIRLRSNIEKTGKGAMGGVIAAAVILNPLALLIKGKNITIKKGESYTVYVEEDILFDPIALN